MGSIFYMKVEWGWLRVGNEISPLCSLDLIVRLKEILKVLLNRKGIQRRVPYGFRFGGCGRHQIWDANSVVMIIHLRIRVKSIHEH